MIMENHGGMISKGETPDPSVRAVWQSHQQSHLVEKHKELEKKMLNFPL
jgi:hypothetical protein